MRMKANEIVSYVKEVKREIGNMYADNIEFLGCSQDYVEEKINSLIFELKELNRHCKAVDKRQSKYPPTSHQ